ncbi:efflux RND transporter periplasmic adaptor subunit [Flavimaribacter sediminis]|nr:HlyD family efflux transporter periplasmic adaptor subunit [Flavimaribacter sediminis]
MAGIYLAFRERPVPVDAAMVERGYMEVTIVEEGVTRVKDVYAVSSPIAGHLDRTTLDEGEPVAAHSTVIASIHPLEPPFLDERTRAELRAAAEAARTAIALAEVEKKRAETAYNLAQSNYRRAEQLARSKTISTSQLEHSFSEMELQRAQVESSDATIRLRKAELDSALARLKQPTNIQQVEDTESCCVHMTAPIDGVVLQILTRSEQAVTPGTRIAEIGDPANLEIVVDLLSSDAARIRPGASVRITDWGGEDAIEGTVRTVEPAAFTKISSLGIEEQRVNIIIDIDEVPASLGHGFRILAHLRVWEKDDVLTVPIAAIFRSGGSWSVFVIDDEKAKLEKVELGRMNDTVAQVLGGLEAGEMVVLYPSDVLEDGKLVEIRPDGR